MSLNWNACEVEHRASYECVGKNCSCSSWKILKENLFILCYEWYLMDCIFFIAQTSIRLFKTECKVVVVGVTASEKRITIKSNSREE